MDMVRSEDVNRFDVFLVTLDSTIGSEIQKTRLCLIISPDEMNRHIQTVIIAPITSTIRNYPTRINTVFQGKKGQIVLDQIRTVDKRRLIKKLGVIGEKTQIKTTDTLLNLFS